MHCTDPQVEVHIRILLKEAAIVTKMWTPAITLWFPEHRFKENFYSGFFIKEKQFASQVVFPVKSKHWVLAKIHVFGLFLAGLLFESSFFSESRLCTWPLFIHVIINLDWLAIQLILWIPPWGQSCARWLYGSLQSWSFLKNIIRSIPSIHAKRKITVRSQKYSFTPHPSVSPYSPTDRNTDRETNKLAARGLEELFSSCAVVSVFWFLVGNRFWSYFLTYLEYNTVVALC